MQQALSLDPVSPGPLAVSPFPSGVLGASLSYVGQLSLVAASSSAQIQATLNAASGKTVYFPAGVFVLSGVVVNATCRIWLEVGAVLTVSSGETAPVLTIDAPDVEISGGGTIDGNAECSGDGVAGVYGTTASSGLNVNGITIRETRGYGVDCNARSLIRRNTFVNVGQSPGAGAILIATSGAAIVAPEVTDNYVDQSVQVAGDFVNSPIQVTGAPRAAGGHGFTNSVTLALISGNTILMPLSPSISGNGNGITISAARSVVAGNRISGGLMSISVDNADDVTVSGNHLFGALWYAIELAEAQRCAITGNTINGNGLTGSEGNAAIYADTGVSGSGASSNATVVGNAISNLASGGTGIALNTGINHLVANNYINVQNAAAITFGQGVAGGSITGNTLLGAQSSGNRGIYISDNKGRIAITGNLIRSFERGVDLAPAASGNGPMDDISITGNNFFLCTAAVTKTVTGSGSLGASICVAGNGGLTTDYTDFAANAGRFTGTGTPEGAVAAGVGSSFARADGGAASAFYVKESGTGNTGWIAK